jgi:hypothetical protein
MGALRRRLARIAMALLVLAIGGCSGVGTMIEDTGMTSPDAPRDRWQSALEMLGEGQEQEADALLVELRDVPGYSERARHMLEQLRVPVHRYFPGDHFNVRLRAGQSLSTLSRRYLDDPLKFFALARYNGIAAPNRVAAGQLIRIPLTEHARRVRTAEMGSPEADDPIDESSGSGDSEASKATSGDDRETRGENVLTDAERTRVRRYYREATIAFQQQDLERTLRYCERVLQLDPDHENCTAYRDRARALQRQLERIERENEQNGTRAD